ncbi:MAG: hypothetical protein U1F68_15650 [Gammaproteobacteria bacterium]
MTPKLIGFLEAKARLDKRLDKPTTDAEILAWVYNENLRAFDDPNYYMWADEDGRADPHYVGALDLKQYGETIRKVALALYFDTEKIDHFKPQIRWLIFEQLCQRWPKLSASDIEALLKAEVSGFLRGISWPWFCDPLHDVNENPKLNVYSDLGVAKFEKIQNINPSINIDENVIVSKTPPLEEVEQHAAFPLRERREKRQPSTANARKRKAEIAGEVKKLLKDLIEHLIKCGRRANESWVSDMGAWVLPFQVGSIRHAFEVQHRSKKNVLPSDTVLKKWIKEIGYPVTRNNKSKLESEKSHVNRLLRMR